MREFAALTRAEWLKLRRRRLTWALLLSLMAVLAMHAASLNADRNGYSQAVTTGVGRYGQPLSPEAARTGEAATAARMTFPGFLNELPVITDMWGIFALLILTAVQAGEEYDAGTVRTILMRGPGRTKWLSSKLAALFLATGVAWVILAAECAAIGLWTHHHVAGSLTPSVLRQVQVTSYAGQMTRSWLATLPYLSLAIMFAVVGRGTGPSLMLGLIGRFLEMGSGVLGVLLIGMRMSGVSRLDVWYRLWAPLNVVSLDWNAQVWRTWGDPLRWKEILGAMGSTGDLPQVPSPLHNNPWLGAAILAGWTIVGLALAAWVVGRRDVTA